jgi:hypothetical protein
VGVGEVRFSKRLQLAPGLDPPTSWSLSPCCGPKFHLRADGGDASRGSSLRVHSVVLSLRNRTGPRLIGEVDPPIEVESASRSAAGTWDRWVKDRWEWFGRVRGPDGGERWIRAVDLRAAKKALSTRKRSP